MYNTLGSSKVFMVNQLLHPNSNVDRVYDLTVVHPGVKHEIARTKHSLLIERNATVLIRLNASWSTLKDQCRYMMPVCASLACMTIK